MKNETVKKETKIVVEPEIIEEVKEVVVEPKKVEPKNEEKIFKNMDIGGTMVRVGDSVVINALPFEKNPFEVISNEEVLSRDGKKYGIEMLQRHAFTVATDQTKPPKFKNQGLIKLNRGSSVISNSGEIRTNENDIQFIN